MNKDKNIERSTIVSPAGSTTGSTIGSTISSTIGSTIGSPHSAGVTLVELLVALAIGSFLIIGAVRIAAQSSQAFRVNKSIAMVQETAQFAMDTIEGDLHMASNWGLYSRGGDIEGGWTEDDPDPLGLLPTTGTIVDCGARWALDLARPVEGSDNTYSLSCDPKDTAQANSDTLTVRRASVDTATPDDGRLQIQTTRNQGRIFNDGEVPSGYLEASEAPPGSGLAASETHNLIVDTYYVAASSELIPGVPTLRRKSLTVSGGAPSVVDEEVAPGVEYLQVQLGVDVDEDNSIDRYVNPGSAILDPDNTAYIPKARVLTARVWLVVRSIDRENGIVDDRDYAPGNVDLGKLADNPGDDFRRIQVSKTILLRNVRS